MRPLGRGRSGSRDPLSRYLPVSTLRILIRDESVRKAGFAAVFVLAALAPRAGSADLGEEDAGGAHATLTCERAATAGRVRCEVEARVGPGESIAWGDVVLLSMPPFASALRGRIGPHDASVRE